MKATVDDDKKWSSGKKKRSPGAKLIKLIPCNSASNSPEVEPQESSSDDCNRKVIDQHWKDLNYDRLINDLDHYIGKLDT